MLLDLIRGPRTLELLDPAVERLSWTRYAFDELEVLKELWAQGEEIRLHEDRRFVRSRWDRFYLSTQRLANQAIVKALLQGWDGLDLEGRLQQLDACDGGHHVLDPDDPRLHRVDISGRWVLADLPLPLEDEAPDGVANAEVFTITAAAGRFAAGEAADRRGYVRLRESPRPDCFIVQARGRSMEPGIPHGSYLLVEPAPTWDGVVLAYHPDLVDDLGSCVVKRWVNGKLDSDHPDHRGTALLPEGGSWEDVRVLGRVVKVLGPLDFVGLRASTQAAPALALESAEERQRCLNELAKRRDRWLLPPAPMGSLEASDPVAESQLAMSADGLQLRLLTPPLQAPVDWIQVAGNSTPASNLTRARSWKVTPQSTPYLMETPEQSPQILAPGLEGERATLFRSPLDGVGLRLQSGTVRAGDNYRCLVPPILTHPALELPAWATSLGQISGWAVCELEGPEELAPTDLEWLDHLGLQWEPQALRLSLESAPRSYRQLDSGQQVAELDFQDPVIFRMVSSNSGPVVLLGVSEQGVVEQEFTPIEGDEASLRLQLMDCCQGLSIFQVRCAGHSSAPLAIWIGPSAERPTIPARLSLQLQGKEVADRSVHDLIDQWPQIQWHLPPLWEVRLDAGGPSAQQLRLRADDQGYLNLSATLAPLERQWLPHWFGSLRVVCRGLAERRLFHQRTPGEAELADKLRELAASQDDLDLLDLWDPSERWDRWLRPVLEALGYRPERDPDAAEPIQLHCHCLRGKPLQVRDEALALFSLCAGDSLEAIEAEIPALRLQLKRHRLGCGFLSNGRYWLYVMTSSRHLPTQFDLLDSLEGEHLVEFCRQFGAEA